VIFIDDVTVLDNVNPHFSDFLKRRRSIYQGEKLDDYVFTLDHKFALINKLSKVSDIINSIIENQTLERLLEKISKIVPDDIVVRDSLFVCSSDGLNLSNLAMGTKLFAIIKMLLSNGSLNSKTLLILDEPESHLHPMWQNIIAEIIVLLIKELGIKVIITSHSPNFVLALHTFAIKHCFLNITNFYHTEKKTDGYLVDYTPMNSDLSKVYAEFSKPFSQMKAIFDSLQLGDDND
jgi:predicted ATPase